MEQIEIYQQQKYYEEIQDCIKLENLLNYIQNQDNRIAGLEARYRGYSLPSLVWWALVIYVVALFTTGLAWSDLKNILGFGMIIAICLAYNKYNDNKIRTQVNELKVDLDEKIGMYNSIYNDVKSRFENGEFSVEMDCWHCGNELMKYFHENRAFSFERARYYVDKQRALDAAENGRRNAYNQGYSNGNTDGYNKGYNAGTRDGYSKGKKDGKSSGYSSGLRDGYFLGK